MMVAPQHVLLLFGTAHNHPHSPPRYLGHAFQFQSSIVVRLMRSGARAGLIGVPDFVARPSYVTLFYFQTI